jgi:putative DNA primase/helicase
LTMKILLHCGASLDRWADDNWEALAKAQPEIPIGFYNRVRRNWWLLLAIAESAGCDWAEKIRKAAAAMEGLRDAADIEIELLADTKKVFDAGKLEEIATKSLISALCADEERPWATFAKVGKPITDRHLGKIFGEYNIKSEDVYPHGVHAKGYKRLRFEDAWDRYLRPEPPPPAN